MVVVFFLFFFVSVGFEIQRNKKNRDTMLILACVILAIGAGFRNIYRWPDTLVYAISFQSHTPNLFNFSFSDKPYGYTERGFYFLQVVVKTLMDNTTVFFLSLSALTFYFLYKNIKQYSIFPLIGLCAYISRFLIGRNFIQIRAGIAYLVLMLSIKYIFEKDWKRYFLIVFIAWTLHRSCIVAIPLYFVCNWIHVKKWHVYLALVFSFLVGIFGQGFVHSIVEDNASDLSIGNRYIDAGGEKRQLEGLGMRNPMIYFQCFILLMFTWLEERLAPLNKYYYILRNAYLYSTMILICFCTYKVLSARTSSMYATLEFAIIPSLIFMFNKKNRMFAFLITGVALTYIFYLYMGGRS
jgi:hypothetical protein